MHTTASDGTGSPSQVVKTAADRGVDDLLAEALGDRASVISGAARDLFARGPSGFEVLAARLPTDDAGRGRVLEGVAEVAAVTQIGAGT